MTALLCSSRAAGPLLCPVVVVEPEETARHLLLSELGDAGAGPLHAFASVEAAAGMLRLHPEAIAVFGPGLTGPAELAEIKTAVLGPPPVRAVLVASQLSTSLLQLALRAGLRDAVSASGSPGALAEAVERIARVPSTPAAPPWRGERGRVITVSSMKGGVGKTVVATNLAVLLARRSAGPVALVDADLQFGDVSILLGLSPRHSVVDVVEGLNRLDGSGVLNLLGTHERSGLRVLPGPPDLTFAARLTAADMTGVVEALREVCSHVVVDTPSHFNELVLGLIEVSDDVLIVAGMELPTIKNARLGLETLRMLSVPASKLKLIINRANSKVDLDVAQVEAILELRADCLLPSDIAVPQSVNRGVPVVDDAPRSAPARAFESLADLFAVHSPEAGPKQRGLLRRGRARATTAATRTSGAK